MGNPQRASIEDACFEFGEFRLDPLGRQLFDADGQAIALKPKVFDTLLHLVAHSGELLEKPELMQAIWGKVVVGENSLNQHVSILRRVLGERPGQSRFIKTEPRHGYRFVAEVKRARLAHSGWDNWKRIKSPLRISLPSDREVLFARRIAARHQRAFQVWTSPALLRRWYPPPGWSMVVCKLELRPGGIMRFVTRNADGTEIVQQGIVQQVLRSHRLVHVEHWENPYMRDVHVTTTFPAVGDHSVLNVRVRYSNRKSRDAFLESGLVRDIGGCYDRFARLAEKGSI
jgi:DNA-binding winged helix-turn-helix (wHTH) protein